jgi:prephenate dehydratase
VRVGYLGPPGTFTEEALVGFAASAGAVEAVPYPTVRDCFRAVRAGEVPEILVPIENSLEGSVPRTLDQLTANGDHLVIRAEVVHPIHHHLIARSDLGLGEVERILSHPHAPPQCEAFLHDRVPQAQVVAANSTAEAVRIVSACEEPWAAIGTLRAADLYGCTVIAPNISDSPDHSTRFVLIGTSPAPAVGPGRFRTSIICHIERDRPGALLAILQEFAMRAVNLSRLESRPTRTGLGRYIFFIDIEGSRQRDLPVGAAITAIEEQGVARVTFLGSYPADASTG